MGKLGITGMDSVTQLGAMLQVQMKTAGGSDEAANNLKNWMEKIGSGETVDAYKKAGIDYRGSMQTGLQNGMSTLESSFALAQKYIEATDPKRAAEMAKATAAISKEADPEKAKAMMKSLEEALRTGDLFADMQVKAALTAYMQNKDLYNQLKKDSAGATGILDKNLAERRQTSAQKWSEMAQSMDDAMRSIGDAIRPVTDSVADGINNVSRKLSGFADEFPRVTLGIGTAVAGLVALKGAVSAFKVGKGLMNLGRGTLMGNPNIPQKVIVTNLPGAGGGLDAGDMNGGEGKKGKGGKGDGSKGGGRGGQIAEGMKGPMIFAAVDAGFKAYDTYQNAETQDEKAEGYGQAAGGLAGTLAGAAAGAAIGSAVPIIGNIVGGVIGGYLGYMGGDALGGVMGKKLFGTDESLKKVPDAGPLMMANAGQNLPPVMGDIARSFAPTPAGPLASGVTPPAGAAVSKLLPERKNDVAALGDVARSLATPANAPTPPALLAAPIPAARSETPKVEQRVEISVPLHITVQGDAKDPAQMARELQPYIAQQMQQATQQLQNRKLYDEPHV
jgi:hypothetical protein